jgi:hypothetical protein
MKLENFENPEKAVLIDSIYGSYLSNKLDTGIRHSLSEIHILKKIKINELFSILFVSAKGSDDCNECEVLYHFLITVKNNGELIGIIYSSVFDPQIRDISIFYTKTMEIQVDMILHRNILFIRHENDFPKDDVKKIKYTRRIFFINEEGLFMENLNQIEENYDIGQEEKDLGNIYTGKMNNNELIMQLYDGVYGKYSFKNSKSEFLLGGFKNAGDNPQHNYLYEFSSKGITSAYFDVTYIEGNFLAYYIFNGKEWPLKLVKSAKKYPELKPGSILNKITVADFSMYLSHFAETTLPINFKEIPKAMNFGRVSLTFIEKYLNKSQQDYESEDLDYHYGFIFLNGNNINCLLFICNKNGENSRLGLARYSFSGELISFKEIKGKSIIR